MGDETTTFLCSILFSLTLTIIIILFWSYRIASHRHHLSQSLYICSLDSSTLHFSCLLYSTLNWWWATGRAYFMCCVSGTLLFSRYFCPLFQPDSYSLTALHFFLKGMGLLCLSSCCSDLVLRALLLSMGCFEEHLRHLLWVAYLSGTVLSKTPTHRFLVPKKVVTTTSDVA